MRTVCLEKTLTQDSSDEFSMAGLRGALVGSRLESWRHLARARLLSSGPTGASVSHAQSAFANLLSGRSPAELSAAKARYALDEHVLHLEASFERKRAACSRATDLRPFMRLTAIDTAVVQQLKEAHVLQERIDKRVRFREATSGAPELALRFSFSLERGIGHLFDGEINEYDAHIVDEHTGRTLLRVSEGVADKRDCAQIDALVDAWCAAAAAPAAGGGSADARRDARWYVAAILTHPSDHAFDLVSAVLDSSAP
jgi:hypothetical protein